MLTDRWTNRQTNGKADTYVAKSRGQGDLSCKVWWLFSLVVDYNTNFEINVERRHKCWQMDGGTDWRIDGLMEGQTEKWTPISHPATSRCDKKYQYFWIEKSILLRAIASMQAEQSVSWTLCWQSRFQYFLLQNDQTVICTGYSEFLPIYFVSPIRKDSWHIGCYRQIRKHSNTREVTHIYNSQYSTTSRAEQSPLPHLF